MGIDRSLAVSFALSFGLRQGKGMVKWWLMESKSWTGSLA